MCSSNKCGRIWGGKHEKQRNGKTLRESLFSPSLTCCSPVAVVFETDAEHWSHFCVCMCACCYVCLLCVISPVTMTEEQLYKVQ